MLYVRLKTPTLSVMTSFLHEVPFWSFASVVSTIFVCLNITLNAVSPYIYEENCALWLYPPTQACRTSLSFKIQVLPTVDRDIGWKTYEEPNIE